MRNLSLTIICLISLSSIAQKPVVNVKKSHKPKLVVGIMVDQMRWDYVNRFKPFFISQNGFARFINEGATCDNTMIPYVPTVTA